MSILSYNVATQPTDTWAETIDPANYTLVGYRGTGWVFDFPGDGGTHFWAIMTSATIVEFGQSNGAFGDPTRQDIFTATTSISSVDFYATLSAAGATGQDVFNLLMGSDDTLIGSIGGDIMVAGVGSDTLTGDDGVDRFILQSGAHHVTDLGNGGADSFKISDAAIVDFDLFTDWQADSSSINGGSATIHTNGFVADLSQIVDTDGNGFTITSAGLTQSVTSTGSGLDDVLIGGSGSDHLGGSGGNDKLKGGLGNDTLDGGDGFDTADYSDALRAVTVDLNKSVAQLTGVGSDLLVSIEGVLGGAKNDKLVGNAAGNLLDGAAGSDTLTGNAGDDTLRGGLGTDNLLGGVGDDTLVGGASKDTMDGGTGADSFLFEGISDSAVGRNRDVIKNFHSSEGDVIDFRDIQSQHGLFYHGGTAFTHEAGEIIYSNGLLSVDDNGDGIADMQISVQISSPYDSILT